MLQLDITDDDSVRPGGRGRDGRHPARQQRRHRDAGSLVTCDLADARREMDTHYWGTLAMVRAFAPVIEANGGGGIVNVLSALSWFAHRAPAGTRRRGAALNMTKQRATSS